MRQARPQRSRLRRIVGLGGWIVAGLVAVALAYLVITPTGRYIARAAWEEGRILARRRPIPELVDDRRTAPQVRAKLQLVLLARAFAEDSVGLEPRDSFTEYTQLDTDTLVLVLSGAFRDRLEPHTWWFPIVGRVPYKGFFDVTQARRASSDLERRGFDVYLRPASAFSTLGFFNDPLLSTTLRQDSIDLANTVIHEIVHSTFFARGQAVFNESFANFVGARGAAWFFRSRGRPDAADQADARWQDQKLLARFWGTLHRALDSAFKANPGPALEAKRLAVRDTIFRSARRHLLDEIAPQLRTINPRALERARFDNAALLARRIYLTDLDLFDAVYEREGRNLRATVERVIALAKSDDDDPYGAIRKWLGGSSAHVSPPARAAPPMSSRSRTAPPMSSGSRAASPMSSGSRAASPMSSGSRAAPPMSSRRRAAPVGIS